MPLAERMAVMVMVPSAATEVVLVMSVMVLAIVN